MKNNNLSMKLKRADSKSELKCVHCGKEFKFESEKKRHEQSHSPQFACKVCSKKFSFMSALRRHEKQHERTGSVNCEECNRKFRDESLLKRHIKYAHKGVFTCTKCQATFSSHIALRSHMKTHKPESERRFRCSFDGCTKTFNFAHHLKHHELTHTNTKQHFCNVCGKGFIQYHHLKSHVKIHEPENWLPCSISSCKKTFATTYALKRHIGTHKNVWNQLSSSEKEVKEVMRDAKLECGEIKSFGDHSDLEHEFDTSHSKWDHGPHQRINTLVKASFNSEEEVALNLSNNNNKTYQNLETTNSSEVVTTRKKYEFFGQITSSISNNKVPREVNDAKVDSALIKKNDDPPIKNGCEGCECGKNMDTNNTTAKRKGRDECIDIVEYKSDGSIKIKETQYLDLDLLAVRNNKITKESPPETVPFNSCKAFLGTCIVSENGTMDESCLCAKMAIDDQPLIDQQIDELTPCPTTY